MKKQTILYILLIFLIVSNGFFLVHHLSKSGKDRKSQFSIIKELNFDEKQMEQYNSIKTLHFDRVKSISKDIRSLKEVMYSKMPDGDVPEHFLDSITDLIAIEEKKKDLEMFKHFQNVREICNDEQKEKLTKLINDAIKRRGRRGKNKK